VGIEYNRFRVLRLGNALPSTPLSCILSLGFSLGSSIADAWSRLRYRRAELRRLPPASVASAADAADQRALWSPDSRRQEGAPTILLMPAGACIEYRVTFPDHARVVAHCDVRIEPEAQKGAEIEFTIRVRFESSQVERSCVVTPADGGRILSLPLQKAGPATIVLAARSVGAGPQRGLHARWDNPRIEWPRPARDLVTALGDAVRRGTVVILGRGNRATDAGRLYRAWVRENEPSKRTLRAQREDAAADRRLFTLITLLSDTAFSADSRTAESVFDQSYPHWEWLLVRSAADHRHSAGQDPAADPRVRMVRVDAALGRAARLNQALAAARGEFVGLVDDLDVLAPSALFEMSRSGGAAADADVIYSDEDRRSNSGKRFQPAFKPDWSPDLLLSCNYIGRLALIRTATAIAVGGFRDGFGHAYEWELLLRLSRSGARFRRVVGCLYHRDEAVASAGTDERDAVLLDHGKQLGLSVQVEGPVDESRVRWMLEHVPTVSVIIPNRNAFVVLKTCVDGILEKTKYPDCELIVVDNGSTDRDVLDLYARLRREGRGRIVSFEQPFNFSAACNAGAAEASGDLLLFLNNDIEVVDPDWLEELVRWAQRPGVGVVGAQLLYPDRLIQHAGVVFGLGLVGHIFSRAAERTRGVFGSSEWYRNYLAVTGACQMIPRKLFEQLGGYDERLRLSFSDVVLCMEARKAGYRVVYTPHARLIHHESFTRQKEDSAEDIVVFARYLSSERFVEDPYLHPHLNPRSLVPAVRSPFEPAPRQVIAEFVQHVLGASAVR
jgi:GT2 family glycosyltransferase